MDMNQIREGKVTATDINNALTNVQTLLTRYEKHIRDCLPIAEAEKPELRHGEIRQWPHCIGIVDMSEPQTHLIWADGNKRTPCTSEAAIWRDSRVVGNIREYFDDLATITKLLTELDMQDCDDHVRIVKEGIAEFIQKLQCLQDTARKKHDNQD